MLPEISWTHLGLPGSTWALSRTVPSTLDFFWTGTVAVQTSVNKALCQFKREILVSVSLNIHHLCVKAKYVYKNILQS